MKKYDVVIIGGGPAGLFCAGNIAKFGHSVALIEKNEKVGRKLLITGKGRCNITNMSDKNELISALTKNNKFMYSAFSQFDAYDTVAFFEENGVPIKVERGNRVFPVSDKSIDVVGNFSDKYDVFEEIAKAKKQSERGSSSIATILVIICNFVFSVISTTIILVFINNKNKKINERLDKMEEISKKVSKQNKKVKE